MLCTVAPAKTPVAPAAGENRLTPPNRLSLREASSSPGWFFLLVDLSALTCRLQQPSTLPFRLDGFRMLRATVAIRQIADHPVGPSLRWKSEKLVELNDRRRSAVRESTMIFNRNIHSTDSLCARLREDDR
jgi:hypothetical protein